MPRGEASPPAVQFVPWKPDRCACGAKHPSYSRDGMAGPWRCRACDATATKRPEDPMTNPGPQPKRQDTLL